jgi:hypothetical protein
MPATPCRCNGPRPRTISALRSGRSACARAAPRGWRKPSAHRDALQERTCERVPLDRARSSGDQGVALRVLAERRGDLAMAEQALAVSQIFFGLNATSGLFFNGTLCSKKKGGRR